MTYAVRATEKAHELYAQAGSRRGVAALLGNLGVGLYHTGRLPEAMSVLSRAIQQDVELDMTQRESTAMGDLAMVMWHVGRPGAAHRLLVRAVSKKIAVDDRMGESANPVRPGGVLPLLRPSARRHAAGIAGRPVRTGVRRRLRGELDEALSFAGKALEFSRLSGYRLREGEALTLSAAICHEAGDPSRAVEFASKAAQLHHETGSRLGLAATLALLAKLVSKKMICLYLYLHLASSHMTTRR